MSEQKIIPEKIHLEGVRIMKSHFEVLEQNDQLEITSFAMGFKSEASFDIEEKQNRFRLYVKIKGLNHSQEYIGISGEYHIDFIYYIENLDQFIYWEENEGVKAGENEFSVSQTLGATIAGISYSTSRGIILDRTQSTDFNGILLPVIDPNRLLTDDSFSDL